MLRSSRICVWLSAMAILAVCSQVQASLLVYDGFQDYGTSGTALVGQMPGVNTVGLDATVAWGGYKYATPTGFSEGITSGLTFSTLTTAGGAESINVTGTAFVGYNVLAKVGSGVSEYSSVYQSVLVNINDTAAGNRMLTRVVTDTASSNPRYWTGPTATTNALSNGVTRATYNASAYSYGTNAIPTGQTLLYVSRFLSAGGSDPLTTSSPGTVTSWALSADQFTSWVAAGKTEDYLAAATIGTDANQIWDRVTVTGTSGANGLYTGTYMAISDYVNAGGTHTGIVDEIRYGTTLADVTPATNVTPEPGTLVLLITGLVGLLVFAWKRCK